MLAPLNGAVPATRTRWNWYGPLQGKLCPRPFCLPQKRISVFWNTLLLHPDSSYLKWRNMLYAPYDVPCGNCIMLESAASTRYGIC